MGSVAEELHNELRYDQKLIEEGKPLNLDPFISTTKTETPEGSNIAVQKDKFTIILRSTPIQTFLIHSLNTSQNKLQLPEVKL
ncbi:MAG: hypothetical protein WKG06_05765 [Segetibacter sp.]